MKLICIRNNIAKDIYPLTLGKIYDASYVANYDHWYWIFDDLGEINLYSEKWFISKEEYRDKVLEELGI